MLGIKVSNPILVLFIIVSAGMGVAIIGGGSGIIKSAFSISTSQPQPQYTIQPRQNNNTNSTILSNDNRTIVFRVAFVRPTFTYAAYQLNGFYNFYSKYIDTQRGKNITTDLNLLTVKIPHGPFLLHNQKPGDKPGIKEQEDYFKTLMDHVVENKAPDPMKISNITDKEVNDGIVFNHTNGTTGSSSSNNYTNAYDVLFLFHQEYATQTEYNNLKQFVENGGTIVFNDGNILTTEVRYDNSNDTVTLLRGHNWQYNGKTAWYTGEPERWYNETWKWVGSNFLDIPAPPKVNATFSNDHFGYKHIEEQYVTNPKDKIILDFGTLVYENSSSVEKYSKYANARVAFYELDSGHNNGRVIMLSIFAHKLGQNTDFLDFYDNKVIPLAFAS